ncbi:MAG: SDR family NAD(P)-dependent oxidoreductase [Deltaproteobacteria bacterium]|nr:SDR family NAD(P)-dependent oxidoreductase [Deltaproteobacteria bacterium]
MRKVLITGTSSGIGRATAQFLAERGYFVYAGVRQKAHLQIWEGVKNVKAMLFDVRRDDEINQVVEQIKTEAGGLYALVNNAGISNWGPILDIPNEVFRDNLETNLLGPIKVTRAFLPLLNGNSARIINISSVSGKLIFPFMGPYHVAKAALEAFSDTLRRELLINEMRNIKVVVVEPGSVATRLWDRAEATTVFAPSSPFYQTALSVGHAIIKQERAGAFPPELVSRAVWKALSVRRPKGRYIVSPQSLFFKLLLRLPDSWLDRLAYLIMRRHRRP